MIYFDTIDIFEGIDINRQANKKSAISVTIDIFL